MPVFDQYKETQVKIPTLANYNIGKTFNPGNAQGPWSGYANNVDIETVLRNQTFALQKGDRSMYVPSSNSDLYITEVVGRKETQTHPYLFKNDPLPSFNPNILNLGNDVFNNATRQQLKSINDNNQTFDKKNRLVNNNIQKQRSNNNANNNRNLNNNGNNNPNEMINTIR
jgi:hypothetical protein